MKLKVINEFVDRYTKKLHKVGEEFEADEKRYKEIQRVGNLVEVVGEPIEEDITEEVAETPVKTKKK